MCRPYAEAKTASMVVEPGSGQGNSSDVEDSLVSGGARPHRRLADEGAGQHVAVCLEKAEVVGRVFDVSGGGGSGPAKSWGCSPS